MRRALTLFAGLMMTLAGPPTSAMTARPDPALGVSGHLVQTGGGIKTVRKGRIRGSRNFRRALRSNNEFFVVEQPGRDGLNTLVSDVDSLGVTTAIPRDAEPAPGWQGFDFPESDEEQAN
ncbi:MAG: hypothetical protein AAGE80_02160 [Pseudomonadota bacterium]